MRSLSQEIRFALRSLAREPLVTAVIILTLGLGLGANAATLGWIDSLMLRPFTLPDIDRMVMISENSTADPFPRESVSPGNYFDLAQNADGFETTAAFEEWSVNLSAESGPERIEGVRVSGAFFDLVAAVPAEGRLLAAADDVPGRDKVAVISHGLWQRRFGGAANVVGQPIRLDGVPYSIVGIAPSTLKFPFDSDVWVPLALSEKDRENRGDHYLTMLARRRPDVTFDQAAGQIETLYQRIKQQHPDATRSRDAVVRTLTQGMVDVGLPTILVLWQAAAALVLLIACTNVANLLLARGAARQREFAVRAALGAARWRLVRQLMVESLVLALLATPVAIGVAAIAFYLVRSAMPVEIVRFVAGWNEMGVTVWVVAVTFAAAVTASVLFGTLPALHVSRAPIAGGLRDGGRTMTAGPNRLRRGLVVAEIALALPLLLASVLAILGAHKFTSGWQGYEPDRLVKLRTVLPQTTYPDATARRNFAERLLAAGAAIPGATGVATASSLPSTMSNQQREYSIDGRPADPKEPLIAGYRAVSADYFPVMGIPILEGRGLNDRDRADGERVAVVNRAFANRYFADGTALGRRLTIGRDEQPWVTVVGVAGDTIEDWFIRRTAPTVAVPASQWPGSTVQLVVRTEGAPEALAGDLRRALASVDPGQPPVDVMSMRESVRLRTIGLRFIGGLMTAFGAIALVLAAVGIYTVMAYYVSQRRHEMGVRLALGGRARDMILLTLGHAARMSGLGIAIGLGLGILLARVLENALFGIIALEPWLIVAMGVLLGVISATASIIPARKAARIDPATALRQ